MLVDPSEASALPRVADAVDRILVREAGPDVAGARRVVVVDDLTGALAIWLRSCLRAEVEVVRCHDSLVSENEVSARLDAAGLQVPLVLLEPGAFEAADLVVLRLQPSVAALAELAQGVAAEAAPGVRVLGGARIKHLSRGMNAVLARHFDEVDASLGVQKCRVLRAAGPRPGTAWPDPRTGRLEELELNVTAYAGVFGGGALDLGTRLLLGCRDRWPAAGQVIDLGCGTGVLAAVAARQLCSAHVLAVDESWAAVRSAYATAVANGLTDRISVDRADGLTASADDSADLILCNPPFHRGTAKDSSVAFAMFAAAGRVLRPGGELWLVYNAHLPYLQAVRRLGPTTIEARDRHYLVTRTVNDRRPGNADRSIARR